MIRLLQSECKKIWKSKVNIVLLLMLFVFSGWRIYDVYTESGSSTLELEYPFTDVEGNEITGFAYYQFADEYHHRFAGDLQPSTIKKMRQEFNDINDTYVRKTLDDAYMRLVYGEDYGNFLEKARSGAYDYVQLHEQMKDMYVNGFSMDEEGTSNVYFDYYYMEDRVLALYSKLYTNYYTFASTKDKTMPPFAPGGFFKSLSQRVINRNLPIESEFYTFEELPAQDIVTYYDQKYKDTSNMYDSTISNTIFVNALFSLEFTSILILIIILSNTFAMEKHHKIDQIIVPTNMGWQKITMAKVGSGLLLAIGIVVVQVCMVLLISCILLPMRNLDLAYFTQAGVFMNKNVANFIYNYKEIIGSGILLMLFAAMSTSLITCFCSYITKHHVLCVIPLLLIALVTGSMHFFDFLSPGSRIDMFFPTQMVHFTQYFQIEDTMRNVVQIGSTIFALKDIVLVFTASMLIVLTGVMYWMSKRHVVKA